jgi:hypothetical protein
MDIIVTLRQIDAKKIEAEAVLEPCPEGQRT